MKKLNNFYTDIYSFFILKKKFNKNRVERIFSLLRVDNTFKTTSLNRMFDVNQKLKWYIKKYFSREVMICDIGISSGQTTLELHNDLKKIKLKKIYGFDKNINIKIFRIKKLIFLFSSQDDLLMVEYKKNCLRYRYFIILKKIEIFLIYFLKLMKIKCEKSNVLAPNLKKIEKCRFIEQNIFHIEKKYYNLFDVVRVSNLLNYSYFSKNNLKTAISNINKISKEKSIILVNRTNNKKKNLASFFIKKNGKFELLKDINGGSEIKDLILSLK